MQALSHGSHEVILQEVEVPWAVVKIPSGAMLPPQSGGSRELAKQKIDITVSSDDLLPVPHGGDGVVERDPTLMREDDAYEVITTYPLDTHNSPLWEATAKYALRAMSMLGCAGLGEVKVLRMSKEKPWLFQVRSQKAFSKNELVLMPYGELSPKSQKTEKAKVHEVHLRCLPLILTAPVPRAKAVPKAVPKAKARGKGKGPEPQSEDVDNEKPCPKMEMVVVSPLATSFDPRADTIQPFWAVNRLSRASILEPNMEAA